MDAFGNELNRLLVDTYRIAGKIEQVLDLLRGEVKQLKEAAVSQIECHKELII